MGDILYEEWASPKLIWDSKQDQLFILGGSKSWNVVTLNFTENFSWSNPPLRQLGPTHQERFPSILNPYLRSPGDPNSFELQVLPLSGDRMFSCSKNESSFHPMVDPPKFVDPSLAYVSNVAWLPENPPYRSYVLYPNPKETSQYAAHQFESGEVRFNSSFPFTLLFVMESTN
jgi:hypothetical protein